MKLVLHKLRLFNILTTEPSFINYKLKGQNCSLESYNFATHVMEAGMYILYIMQLLSYWSIKSTMIYTHVSNKAINQYQSPLDRLNLKTEIKAMKKIKR
jgi:hypothetical protein